MNEDIMDLIIEYINKHPLAAKCGSEYIYQNDEAQVDALKLVVDICDVLIP